MKKIVLNSSAAKQLGRTYLSGETLCLVMSGTGCEFRFTGRKLVLSIGCDAASLESFDVQNLPRIAVLVNGKFVLKKVIASRHEEFCAVDSSHTVTADIRIIKLSEAAFSIAELYPAAADDNAEISPTESKRLSLEFIGDSITCGYGTDDSNVNSTFSTCTENFMKSYAYLTAGLLDADCSAFSASGYGIISGYTSDGTRNPEEIIPPFYESYGFSCGRLPDGGRPQDIRCNFSDFPADIAVINLGTNDAIYCAAHPEACAEFEAKYLEFIRTVRKCRPSAEIICSLGIMDKLLLPEVKRACERYVCETGDKKLRVFEFEKQDGNLGYSADWHPSEDTQLRAAEALAEFIGSIS